MKERVFPLVSLGAAGDETPDAADVAAWISGKKGNTADIITYTLDKTLKAQKPYTAAFWRTDGWLWLAGYASARM